MAEPVRRETDDEKRRRELAASEKYAAQVARDPEMTRRIEEIRARMAAGDFDENNVIPYETMQEMIRRLGGKAPKRPES
jgi:hypothetical protein